AGKIVQRIILNNDIPDNNKALLCLCWVLDNVKYAYDLNPDGTQGEYWNFAFETLLPRSADSPQLYGDCEDNAILLANLMLISGIPYWKIRLTVGMVDDGSVRGGHAFVTFFDEPRTRWVLLDPVFYPNKLPVEQRKNYKDETFYKETWFSWSECYCWAKDVRDIGKMNGVKANG
ncbi:MAG: transglutaminase-like domain-containing protein, partial [Planctomycetota bacterium]